MAKELLDALFSVQRNPAHVLSTPARGLFGVDLQSSRSRQSFG
jgi:hypothetical protein